MHMLALHNRAQVKCTDPSQCCGMAHVRQVKPEDVIDLTDWAWLTKLMQ